MTTQSPTLGIAVCYFTCIRTFLPFFICSDFNFVVFAAILHLF